MLGELNHGSKENFLARNDFIKYLHERRGFNVILFEAGIGSRIAYLNYYLDFVKDNNWRTRFTARDSAMADNVIWLKENIYKNEKLIIVGHNFHLSKYNEKEEVMGEYLKKRYPNEIYSIGTFVGAGKYFYNSGKAKEMDAVDDSNLDIRHFINSMQGKTNFLPFSEQVQKGGKWLFEDIIVNNSFINLNSENRLILAKSFDGILLLDKTSIPEKIE